MKLAAQNSEKVQALRQVPWIQETNVRRAEAEFDPSIYAESRYDDTSDPVGNTLTTGGPPRLNDNNWRLEAGVRKRLSSGASVKLFQQFGHKNSNSIFFVPNDQGTSRLSLELNQPLLRGRGTEYNTSVIVTAEFETEAAHAQYLVQLQNHLNSIAQTYWSLYLTRATLLQQQRHLQRAVAIAGELERRRVLDSVKSQAMRANAAVATRRAELSQADARIKNAESRLRAMINVPIDNHLSPPELVPMQVPMMSRLQLSTEDQIQRALKSRPEIKELVSRSKAAGVRIRTAGNEMMPTLNLIAEAYVAGLAGRSGVGRAWGNQFSEGTPSFAVGLEFDLPYRNQAAAASVRQRNLEKKRLQHLLNEAIANVHSEVEIALRNVNAVYEMALSRRKSLRAVIAEVSYLEDRWKRFRGDPSIGRLQLDDLLSAHDRLLDEEQALTTAMVKYSLSIIELQRVTGTLVISE